MFRLARRRPCCPVAANLRAFAAPRDKRLVKQEERAVLVGIPEQFVIRVMLELVVAKAFARNVEDERPEECGESSSECARVSIHRMAEAELLPTPERTRRGCAVLRGIGLPGAPHPRPRVNQKQRGWK